MTVQLLQGYAGLTAAVGRDLGTSDWLVVDQRRIDLFAETTGDHAWIHVDERRAAAGPYGRTIAHGLLTLSLVTMLAARTFRVAGLHGAVHYGYDRVRFVRPVPVGSSIRAAHVTLTGVSGDPAGTRASYRATVEVTGADAPACAVDLIYFYEFDPGP